MTTLGELKEIILSKTTRRQELPEDINIRIFSAMKRIARECNPLYLTVAVADEDKDKMLYQVIANPLPEIYILFPTKPSLDKDKITMDDILMDAIAFLVLAGFITANAKSFTGLYYKEKELYQQTLMESDHNTSYDRFNEFP